MKTLTLVLMLILAGSSVYADQRRWDGYWWESTSEDAKIGYVTGLADGTDMMLSAIDGWAGWTWLPESFKKESRTPIPQLTGKAKEYFENLTEVEKKHYRAAEKLIFLLNEKAKEVMTTLYSYEKREHGLYGLTFGQLVAGLDEFYKDFRNKQIKVRDAIYVVKMQLEGMPEEAVQRSVKNLRDRVRIELRLPPYDELLKKYDVGEQNKPTPEVKPDLNLFPDKEKSEKIKK